jgi:hypothetical protein
MPSNTIYCQLFISQRFYTKPSFLVGFVYYFLSVSASFLRIRNYLSGPESGFSLGFEVGSNLETFF